MTSATRVANVGDVIVYLTIHCDAKNWTPVIFSYKLQQVWANINNSVVWDHFL